MPTIYTTQQRVDDYFDRPELNQSKLKSLKNITYYQQKENKKSDNFYDEKGHFIFGNAVDTLLTQPEDAYDKIFYRSALESKPSDKVMSILQEAFSNATSRDINDQQGILLQAIKNHNYYANRKADTNIANVIKEGENYWNELIEAGGRQIISKEESDKINKLVTKFNSSELFEKYFQSGPEKIVMYQVPLYFEMQCEGKTVHCKMLLDTLVIDTLNKTVQVIDIKTLYQSVINFNMSYYKNGYDFQATFYTFGLDKLLKKNLAEQLKVDVDFTDYKQLDFGFVAMSTTYLDEAPTFWKTNKPDVIKTFQGVKEDTIVEGITIARKRKGVMDLVSDYLWYLENGFTYQRELVENKFELEL